MKEVKNESSSINMITSEVSSGQVQEVKSQYYVSYHSSKIIEMGNLKIDRTRSGNSTVFNIISTYNRLGVCFRDRNHDDPNVYDNVVWKGVSLKTPMMTATPRYRNEGMLGNPGCQGRQVAYDQLYSSIYSLTQTVVNWSTGGGFPQGRGRGGGGRRWEGGRSQDLGTAPHLPEAAPDTHPRSKRETERPPFFFHVPSQGFFPPVFSFVFHSLFTGTFTSLGSGGWVCIYYYYYILFIISYK